MLEGLPGLAGRQPGFPTAPDDATLPAVLRLLFQHLEEGGQGLAVAGGGETRCCFRPHRGQLELVAQIADAFLRDAGVRHPHTPAVARLPVARLPVSRRS